MSTHYFTKTAFLKGLIMTAIVVLPKAPLMAQNFHVMVSMELTYNHVYAPGKFQWVARMFMYKTGTSSFNDRRLESACFDFSYDTTKLKNPRIYVIRSLRPILSPTAPYSLTQGIYTVNPGNPITAGMPANHVRYDAMATTTNFRLNDTNYMGTNFNSCYNCGEIIRIYFDIDSSSTNTPPVYMINNHTNSIYRDPNVNGFLADTVYDGVSTHTSVGVIPPNPIANPWFKWPYDATGSCGSAGGLDNDWKILRTTGGTISSWSYSGYVTGILIELPVDVFDFNVIKQGTAAQLDWKTATTDQINYFEIERSQHGLTWQSIGLLTHQDKEFASSDHAFIDQNPLSGMNYYRIKHVDFNGQVQYSDIQWINMNNKQIANIVLYPNPNNGYVYIQKSNNSELIELNALYGQAGQLLRTFNTGIESNTLIDVSDLAPGIYWLEFKQGDQYIVKKLLKD